MEPKNIFRQLSIRKEDFRERGGGGGGWTVEYTVVPQIDRNSDLNLCLIFKTIDYLANCVTHNNFFVSQEGVALFLGKALRRVLTS